MSVERAYVTGPWGQVHLRRRPGAQAAPTVLFLHESPLSSRVFEEVLRHLSGRYSGVALDTPGYGLSDPPPAEVELVDYARVLLDAVAGMGIERFVACGVHTGAAIALEMCRQAGPGAARGLVMSGVPLFTEPARADFLAGWCPPIVKTTDGAQYDWAVRRYRRIYGPDATAEMMDLAITELMPVAQRYSWAYTACFRYDAAPALRALRSPMLLLCAEHDMFADQDTEARSLASVPCERIVMPGLRGQPHLRRPADYAAHVEQYVDRLGSG